jgi:KDO2-lipid IV(A) lauroyltransferase
VAATQVLGESPVGDAADRARAPWKWRAVASLAALLPFRALPMIGALLAFVAFDLVRIRRRHVLHALARAGLGGAPVARSAYRSLGTGALELAWLAGRPRADLGAIAHVEGWDRFEEARAQGRGVIVATAHTGNWDLAACACAAKTPLAVVTKRLSARGLDAFWQTTRRHRGLTLLAAPLVQTRTPSAPLVQTRTPSAPLVAGGGVLSSIRTLLARGEAVALLVDQDPERTSSVIEAPFLGAQALHDVLPATIAARTGAPIVVALARRQRHAHVVEIVEVLTPPPHAGHEWIELATRRIAAAVDAFVRRHPESWLWLHRRWKTQRR